MLEATFIRFQLFREFKFHNGSRQKPRTTCQQQESCRVAPVPLINGHVVLRKPLTFDMKLNGLACDGM